MTKHLLRSNAIWFVLGLLVWELAGRLGLLPTYIVPTPSSIILDYFSEREIYLYHTAATIKSSVIGFVIGSAVAIAAAILFCRFPRLEIGFRGVNITLFAIPKIVVGPLLVIFLGEGEPQIVLAALSVYFPAMASTLVGLRDIDPRLVDLIHAYGGGENGLMRLVRMRASLPSMLAGLRMAASLAVLGAILGEFGSGEPWGLGTFLLGSLAFSNAARLWGISLAAVGVAFGLYAAIALISRRIVRSSVSVTLAANILPDRIGAGREGPLLRRLLLGFGAALIPILLWWLILLVTRVTPIIAPNPFEIVMYLFGSTGAEQVRATLFHALTQTLPITLLGMFAGLAVAFVLAALTFIRPDLNRMIVPATVLMQNTPLVALAPIILLIFGRNMMGALAMTILVVFFPAFVLLAQGFELVPRSALDVVATYGGGRLRQLQKISVPFSLPYLFAAAKLVVPRALLGVIVAEWLLTGTGLGQLLEFSRAMFDYPMVWSGAIVSVLIAVSLYQLIAMAERLWHRRYAPGLS
jgi:sulfonate transport system permease protein